MSGMESTHNETIKFPPCLLGIIVVHLVLLVPIVSPQTHFGLLLPDSDYSRSQFSSNFKFRMLWKESESFWLLPNCSQGIPNGSDCFCMVGIEFELPAYMARGCLHACELLHMSACIQAAPSVSFRAQQQDDGWSQLEAAWWATVAPSRYELLCFQLILSTENTQVPSVLGPIECWILQYPLLCHLGTSAF
jgi:hypothetical protein